jgi:hypothetical protein
VLKKVFSIALSILLLLPSIGFHFDLTYCCGNLETIGILHDVHLELEDCCEGRDMMEQMQDCMDEVEIITSPSYSVFTSSVKPTVDVLTIPVVHYFFIEKEETCEALTFDANNDLKPPPPELYIQHQSFLC